MNLVARPSYAQGMGATDASGFVVSFPLSSSAQVSSTAPDGTGKIDAGTSLLTIQNTFSATFAVGQTIYQKNNGAVFGKIISLGTGSGGNGTYNLDTVNAGGVVAGTEFTAYTGAAQFFCDTANGNNIQYNGLSPYPGFRMNGTGSNFQVGATGQGASDSAYGPFESYLIAFLKIPAVAFNQSGNQIFLREGQTFNEGGAIFTIASIASSTITVSAAVSAGFIEPGLFLSLNNVSIVAQLTSTESGGVRGGRGTYQISSTSQTGTNIATTGYPTSNNFGGGLNSRFGESIAFPLCIQSYNGADPLNVAKHGRAIGANRPFLQTLSLSASFTGSISGTTLTIDSGSVIGPAPRVGQFLTGAGIPANVFILSGSNLTWTLNVPLTLGPALAISSGGIGQQFQTLQTNNAGNPVATSQVVGNWALRGLNFTGTYSANNGLSFGGNAYNILVENCVFSNGGMGAGSTVTTGLGNQQNVIFRHCSVGQNWSNATGVGASGFGTGLVNGMFLEDCIVYRGGWIPGANGRQEATFMASMTGGTMTVSGVTGTIAIGQGFTFANGQTGFITGGSGSSWTTNNNTTVGSSLCISTNLTAPTIFDHGMYLAHGSNDQQTCRRCVVIDCSASGISGRGNQLLYHNVLIDNPVQAVAGGSSNSPAPAVASIASATYAAGVLTVTAMNAPPLYNGAIYPSQSTILKGSGVVGSPQILSQVTPLTGGETLGGVGRYNISSDPGVVGPQAFTTFATSYMGESPGGVIFNYHHNLVLGGNNLNDIGFRCEGFAATDGIVGSSFTNNLFANNNKGYGSGIAFLFQNDAALDWPSYLDISGNVSYNWSPLLSYNASPANFPAQVFTTTSPGNNTINHWTVSSGTYNSGTGVVSLTLSTPATFQVGATVAVSLIGSGADITKLQPPNANSSQLAVFAATVVSGTNVQFNVGTGLTITISGGDLSYSPASNAQVYSALGFSDRDTMALAMMAAPEQNWAYQILRLAGALFGFQFATSG